MKRLKTYYLVSSLIAVLFSACNQSPKKTDPKAEVLSKHDELMKKGEEAMSIKMQLDTLKLAHFITGKSSVDTIQAAQQIKNLKVLLTGTDEAMEDWMHQYQADYKGKSQEETEGYYKTEADKLNRLDQQYDQAIKASSDLLHQFHIAPVAGTHNPN